jgi:hypothetical protein
MPTTVDQARGLIGFLSPLCGSRATGKVVVVPPTAATGNTLLGPNWWLYPVVGGALRVDRAYRVLPNYSAGADAGYVWTIPPGPGGLAVDVEAHVGGSRFNLPAGTTMAWADDVPSAFVGAGASLAVEAAGITGGDDIPQTGSDRLYGVAVYENLGAAYVALDLFRSSIGGKMPGAMICWDSGATDATFVGRGRQGYRERFNVLLVCDRADSDSRRRGEGMRLLDKAVDLILWKQIYGDELQKGGGIIVSAIHHANVIGRFRLAPPDKSWSQSYIYGLRIEATRIATDTYSATMADLEKARIKANIPVANPPGDPNPLQMVDVTVPIDDGDAGTGPDGDADADDL